MTCTPGKCAHGNFACPNGCKDTVDLDVSPAVGFGAQQFNDVMRLGLIATLRLVEDSLQRCWDMGPTGGSQRENALDGLKNVRAVIGVLERVKRLGRVVVCPVCEERVDPIIYVMNYEPRDDQEFRRVPVAADVLCPIEGCPGQWAEAVEDDDEPWPLRSERERLA